MPQRNAKYNQATSDPFDTSDSLNDLAASVFLPKASNYHGPFNTVTNWSASSHLKTTKKQLSLRNGQFAAFPQLLQSSLAATSAGASPSTKKAMKDEKLCRGYASHPSVRCISRQA